MMRALLFLLLVVPFISQSRDINWVVVDYPPYYILQGDLYGKGRDESIISLISPLLKGYREKRHLMPASRAVKALGRDNDVYCMASLFKTQAREKFIVFSDEFATLGLSPAIAIRKDLLKKLKLDSSQPISLNELINTHKLTLGITLNRAYGSDVDAVISTLPKHQVSVRAGRDTLESLTYMLMKGRLDIILGYPSEHHYLKSHMDKNDQLTQLYIKEANTVVKGYVGCSNNEQGKQVISQINKALAQTNKSKEFNAIMLRWLPDNFHPALTPYLVNTQ